MKLRLPFWCKIFGHRPSVRQRMEHQPEISVTFYVCPRCDTVLRAVIMSPQGISSHDREN